MITDEMSREKGGIYMNCKQYRACLMGMIAVALICGMLLIVKHYKENSIPSEGTLVENTYEQDGTVTWA